MQLPEGLIDALAIARITRLVTKDELADPLRDWWITEAYGRDGFELADRDPQVYLANDEDPPKLAYLITCPWCTSVWIAVGVVAARRFAPGLWDPLARALAFSHLAGLGANLDVE